MSDEEAYDKFIYLSEDESSGNNTPNKPKTNPDQIKMIENFTNRYSAKTSTKEVYDQLWDTLSIDLNSIGPPVRNSMEWRRIWSLYKYNQKRKGSAPPQSSKKRTCECQSITGSTQKPAYSRENIAIDQDNPSDVNIASEQDIPSQQNFPSEVECSSIHSSADLCAVVQLVVTKLDQILEVLVDLKSVLGRSS